jgi:hypothetical protein
MPFRDFLSGVVPTSLQRTVWAQYLTSLGDSLDALRDRTKAAVQARFPTKAPSDGLDGIGGDREINRGSPYNSNQTSNESDSSYLGRLLAAWSSWATAGSANGLLQALYDAGYRTCLILTPLGKQYSLDGSRNLVITALPSGSWFTGGLWNWFDLFFPVGQLPTFPTSPTAWSPFTPASNSDVIKSLFRLIRKWIPGWAKCNSIIAVTTGGTWGYPFPQFWPWTTYPASTVMQLGQTIIPPGAPGHEFQITAITGDLKTGGSEPSWNTGSGATTTDNHVTWTEIGTPEVWGGDAQAVYHPDF